MRRTIGVSVDGIQCFNPHTSEQVLNALKSLGKPVNGMTIRAGNDYSEAYLLLNKVDLTSTFLDNDNHSIKVTDGDVEIEYEGWVIESTLALFPATHSKSFHLVHFVDKRYHYMRNQLRLEVEPFEPTTYVSSETHAEDWEEAISAYWDSFSVATLVQTDADYPSILLTDTQTGVVSLEGSWDKLNAILEAISHIIVHTKTGYAIEPKKRQNGDNADLVSDSAQRLLGKRSDEASGTSFVPETLNIRFRKDTGDYFNQTQEFTYVNSSDQGALPDTERDIHLWNIYDPSAPDAGDVLDDLETLADEVSALFYDACDNHNIYNAIYEGALDFANSANAYKIEFFHALADGMYKTRVVSIDMGDAKFVSIPVSPPDNGVQVLIKAPPGGIPRRVGQLLGSATCDVWGVNDVTGLIVDTDENLTVKNWASTTVCANGDRYGWAEAYDGIWWVVSEDCSDEGSVVSTGGGTGTGNDVPAPFTTFITSSFGYGTPEFVEYDSDSSIEPDEPPPE